jgi:protein-S-isoprenylcysteine O-methyltransferase Ste14
MRATEFEFRYRFWFICLAYFMGFGCYRFDSLNVAAALARWIFRASDPRLHSLAAHHALQAMFAGGAMLVAAAAWIRTWGAAYLRTEVVHDTVVHAERLVADGPYRHVRNPLYVGNLLLATGMATLASRTGGVVLILANLLIVLRLIGREEAALAESQGEAYRAFVSAVPRLWPCLRPCLPAGGMQPKWPQAFLGQAWIWCFALNGFLFAWRRSFTLYYTFLWVSGAAYFLMWMVLSRLRRRNSPPAAPDKK